MNEIKAGSIIPAFTLPDQNGNMFNIGSLIGKNTSFKCLPGFIS